ncbi:hypothetical protein KDL01_12750 [Actinospica durhamensis]|uniref:Uncharacterized protein n=1 Tax=Actinospica durhamensis TaxID=1508375 RepID=A0A941EPG9_9ACTN|nr:hypothetical protein [Actinospica durhamensis]MBR7834138.1 hypothetical protein [Actinospica durhamensis]
MLDHDNASVAALARPGGGTWTALALVGLFAWWGLWGEAVEHTSVPNGFVLLFSLALAGIAVSRWLARYGAVRLVPSARAGAGWFDSGSALYVGVALLLPGSACWLALRSVRVGRLKRSAGRTRETRLGLAALWMLWAVAGTAGQTVPLVWAMASNDPGTGLAPEIILQAGILLNVAAMGALMYLEPRADPSAERRSARL